MSKVISFLNRKGGTGKTTSAINMACIFKRQGFEVTVVETDDNYSLGELRELELERPAATAAGKGSDSFPQLLQVAEANAAALVEALTVNMVDIIIVDGAANMSADAMCAVAALSEVVVIPTSLSANEIMVTEKTIADITQADPAVMDRIVLLANRVHFLTAQDTIARSLARLRVPVMPVYIPYFKVYQYLSTVNPAISPASMAAGNYKKAVTWLLKTMAAKAETAAGAMA